MLSSRVLGSREGLPLPSKSEGCPTPSPQDVKLWYIWLNPEDQPYIFWNLANKLTRARFVIRVLPYEEKFYLLIGVPSVLYHSISFDLQRNIQFQNLTSQIIAVEIQTEAKNRIETCSCGEILSATGTLMLISLPRKETNDFMNEHPGLLQAFQQGKDVTISLSPPPGAGSLKRSSKPPLAKSMSEVVFDTESLEKEDGDTYVRDRDRHRVIFSPETRSEAPPEELEETVFYAVLPDEEKTASGSTRREPTIKPVLPTTGPPKPCLPSDESTVLDLLSRHHSSAAFFRVGRLQAGLTAAAPEAHPKLPDPPRPPPQVLPPKPSKGDPFLCQVRGKGVARAVNGRAKVIEVRSQAPLPPDLVKKCERLIRRPNAGKGRAEAGRAVPVVESKSHRAVANEQTSLLHPSIQRHPRRLCCTLL